MRGFAYLVTGVFVLAALACSASDDSGQSGISGSGAANGTDAGTGAGATDGSGASGINLGTGGSSAGSTGIDLGGSSAGGTTNAAESCDGKLTGYVRDFTPQHLDFEVAAPSLDAKYPARVAGKLFEYDPGIVAANLDADFKPVYAGDATLGTKSTTGKANFDQWFRDSEGVNQGKELVLQFEDPDGDKKFTFDNGGADWFPIDGELLGNYMEYAGGSHNFHLTFELHSKFIYRPGMVFEFSGDDDVWVFINNQLVIDLGGVHVKMDSPVALDTLGLGAGETYQLDFFWAERHIVESNFKIETSIEFIDCGIPVVR